MPHTDAEYERMLHDANAARVAAERTVREQRERAERAETRCRLHPDGSFTGTGDGGWQCDQCNANDQYRERFFTAEQALREAQGALERIVAVRHSPNGVSLEQGIARDALAALAPNAEGEGT